jgi:DNA-binding LytR/AlgR family response regulator
METKLNIAILEDSAILLKELVRSIQDLKLAEVRVKANNSEDFINKIESYSGHIDALILDIDLAGDSMNGIDIANYFQKPVLFITGKTREYIDRIEELKIFKDTPVEFLTKTGNDEKLLIVFQKFEKQIRDNCKEEFISLKFINGFNTSVKQSDIVLIESNPDSTSNNKLVYLITSEEPREISKTSIKELFERGLSREKFVKTSQSCLINEAYLGSIEKDQSTYTFSYEGQGFKRNQRIEISRDYRESIRKR